MKRYWFFLAGLLATGALAVVVAAIGFGRRPSPAIPDVAPSSPSEPAATTSPPPPSKAPAPSSTVDYRPRLLGQWKHVSRLEPERVRTVGITTYRPDGTLSVEGELRVSDRKFELRGQGVWSLEGDKLTTTLKESSYPELLFPNKPKEYRIIFMDEHRMVYEDEAGEEWIELRMPGQ
jgi:hypothetical protein